MSNEGNDEPLEDDYALMILRNRLAKGEITIDEFNTLKKTLAESNSLEQIKNNETKYDSEGHNITDSAEILEDIDSIGNPIRKGKKDPLAASEEGRYNNEVFTIKGIQPKISIEDIVKHATETAEKNSKGGFLGRGKILENAFAWERFFYPYYDLEIEETVQAVEKRGWFKKENVTKTLKTGVSFDAVTGAVVDVSDNGISYVYAFLKDLIQDEINLLYYTSSVGRFSIQDLRGLGHSDTKVRRLADGLSANGILTKQSTRPATYQQVHPYPTKPTAFMSLTEKYQAVEFHSKDRTILARTDQYYFQSKINSYWLGCGVISSVLVYYPYYGITYKRESTARTEIIDGITGLRQPYLDRIVSVKPEYPIK